MDINSDSFKKAQSIFRKYYQNGSGKRNEAITLEQAKKRFNEYYNARGKTPIGKLRAKMFDSMYQKKPKFTIKCNATKDFDEENNLEPGQCEPGSAKYLLEEGPRTFDITGLDYFDEGEEVTVNNDFGNDTTIVSKGATYKKDTDENSDVETGEKDPNKIYGPRVKYIEGNEDKLYSNYFKEQYMEQKETNTWESRYDDDADVNLVDEYWRQYHEGTHLHRKNRKTRKLAKRSNIDDDDDISGVFSNEVKLYSFETNDDETYYLSNELKILNNDAESVVFDNINSDTMDREILDVLLEIGYIINIGDDDTPKYELNPDIDDMLEEDEDMLEEDKDMLEEDEDMLEEDKDMLEEDNEEPESPSSTVSSPSSRDSSHVSPLSSVDNNPSSRDSSPEIKTKAEMINELVRNGYEKSDLDDKLTHEIIDLYNALLPVSDIDEVEEELSGEVFKYNGELYLIRSDNNNVAKLILDENDDPIDIDDKQQYESLEQFLSLYGLTEDQLEYDTGEDPFEYEVGEEDLNEGDFL